MTPGGFSCTRVDRASVENSQLNRVTLPSSTKGASGPDDPRETVGAPFFAADAVVDDEKAAGIVFLFDGEQLRVVFAPICSLPFGFEKAAFRDIGAGVRRHLAQFRGGRADRVRLLSPGVEIGFVARKTGEGRRLTAADHGEGKGVEDGGVGRRVSDGGC